MDGVQLDVLGDPSGGGGGGGERAGFAEQRLDLEALSSAAEPGAERSFASLTFRPKVAAHNPEGAVMTKDLTHVRYTAVCCRQPIEFKGKQVESEPEGVMRGGYRLAIKDTGRPIKMLIVVTAYNEDAAELDRTLAGVAANLETYVRENGESSWREVAVVVVLDGRAKANPSTLAYAEALGCFDLRLMALHSMDMDVRMHLFEHTAVLRSTEGGGSYPPLQEHNGGKLDSHLWFFNAFAEQVNPKFCFLLDVGTQPRPTALYMLFERMEHYPNIAGVCGEITTLAPDFTNPIVAAQHFEYKVSHTMDKALESALGFISVLPGAFSGYRFEAIRERGGKGPLVEYFKSITTPMQELGAFKANMYLAEDRILCFELIARKGCRWTLSYVKNAVAETDVPQELHDLIKQRRRWLNGSFFAMVYALINFNRFWNESRHPLWRKLVVSVQFGYYALNLAMTWLLLANFYLAFFFLVTSTDLFGGEYAGIGSTFNLTYMALIVAQIIMGLGNKPEQMRDVYTFTMLVFGVFAYITIILTAVFLTSDDTFLGIGSDVIIGVTVASVAVYFVSAMLHGELWHVTVSFPQYLLLLPTFINVFTIYSYCNVHDVSWGTKGITEDDDPHAKAARVDDGSAPAPGAAGGADVSDEQRQADEEQRVANEKMAELLREQAANQRRDFASDKKKVEKEFKAFRSAMLIAWLGTNGLFAYIVGGQLLSSQVYLPVLFITAALFIGLRFVGSVQYLIDHYWRKFSALRSPGHGHGQGGAGLDAPLLGGGDYQALGGDDPEAPEDDFDFDDAPEMGNCVACNAPYQVGVLFCARCGKRVQR